MEFIIREIVGLLEVICENSVQPTQTSGLCERTTRVSVSVHVKVCKNRTEQQQRYQLHRVKGSGTHACDLRG